jgi:hypothetical protein
LDNEVHGFQKKSRNANPLKIILLVLADSS